MPQQSVESHTSYQQMSENLPFAHVSFGILCFKQIAQKATGVGSNLDYILLRENRWRLRINHRKSLSNCVPFRWKEN